MNMDDIRKRFQNAATAFKMPTNETDEDAQPTPEELRRQDIGESLRGRCTSLFEELQLRIDAADMLAEESEEIAAVKQFIGAKKALRDLRDDIRKWIENPIQQHLEE